MARKPHATYDLELVRQAAAGRWPEILSQLGGVDRSILDGQGHPCPKCGGTDRFHAITSDDKGGAICRQCFNKENHDGFAVLKWLTGDGFPIILSRVADHLGIAPSANGASRNGQRGKGKSVTPAEVDDEGKVIVARFSDWPEGKQPAVVFISERALKIAEDLTGRKGYSVQSIDEDTLWIIDDAGEKYTLEDDDYQVVAWAVATTPAPTPDGDDWKEVEITELDLPDGIVNALLGDKNGIQTIGQLCAVKDDGADFTACVGIGKSKADKIEDAIEKFWRLRKHPRKLSE